MRVGIVGLGKFGRYHFEKYKTFPEVESISIYDPYIGRVDGANVYGRIEHLAANVDAVSITAPSSMHFELALPFLERGIHCFVEKPITTTLISANRLIEIANKNKAVLQVGHIERFNSEYIKWENKIRDILFIDANRLCNYTGRSQDVDVVLDLMIHDIDIVLQHIKSNVVSVKARGAGFCNPDNMDVAYACLEFENGTTATLTAHRASVHEERRTIFYGADTVIGVDYTKNKGDSLRRELESFIQCCKESDLPIVTGEHGRDALDIAILIKKELYKIECTSDLQW